MQPASEIDRKWQKRWEEEGVYNVDLQKANNPYYALVMFPYPSGAKLHVGHWYQYGPTDSYARFLRMQGYDVFFPMGYDAFGLPAENYAIKTGIHPKISIKENTETMTEQFKKMGCIYDWSKTLNTSTPEYYKWTQWLFLQMYKHDLAYKKEGNVNYCPSCQTVLANEQVWEGKCERCESEVFQKPLDQWYWKTTAFSQELLDGLDDLDWPEKTKLMQKNWIGRSEGCDVSWDVEDHKRGIIGPINWSPKSRPLAADLNRRLTDVPQGLYTLAADLNRRLTDNAIGRIHSPRVVHLTFTPYKRSAFFENPNDSRRILNIINQVSDVHDIAIHEACAMPDHVHVLVSFSKDRHLEKDIVKKLKGASSRIFQKTTPIQGGHLWGEKMHFEDINSLEQFEKTLIYIQDNPKKAEIDSNNRILSKLPIILDTFTTTVDTIYGVTFVVISPEHPLLDTLTTKEQKKAVDEYRLEASKKTEIDRMADDKEKTGVDTGSFVVHPFTGEIIPLWVADYVLMNYGTGVVMGVPAHDQRDMDFANKYNFPIVQSIADEKGETFVYDDVDKYSVKGTMIDSGDFTGTPILQGRKDVVKELEKKSLGKEKIQYRLRDWLVSRQRYWGAPIPIVYDPEGKPHAIPEEHLPWLLPEDVEFKPHGQSPLAESKELIKRTEKIFGKGWIPEFDTMDTFVCSSFYMYRFLAEGNQNEFVPKDIEQKWMPIDTYIGGPEHACMHLIYTRFATKALQSFGYIKSKEPIKRLIHQGLITNQGAKMSKSKGNVVSPDEFVKEYGSDVFRMYLMFMGPYTQGGDWNDSGIKGIDRFYKRILKITEDSMNKKVIQDTTEVETSIHKSIKKVTQLLQNLQFNTSISTLMECLNIFEAHKSVSVDTLKLFALILSPLAPHLAEELWEKLEGDDLIVNQQWPTYDESKTVADTVTIAIQINGKVRGEIEVPTGTDEEEVLKLAKEEPNVQKHLEGQTLKKEIYIESKLVSLVI